MNHDTNIAEYIRTAKQLPLEALLGHVMMSTTHDGVYDRDDIMRLFEELELDTNLIPPVSGAVDAFNKAITRNKERSYTLPNDNTVTLLIREVTSSRPDEVLVRAVAREVRDAKQAKLSYEVVGEIQLYKGTRRGAGRRMDHKAARFGFSAVPAATMPHLTEHDHESIRSLAIDIRRDWERYRSTLDGRKIAAMVLAYLRKLGAVRLKDSVHFVPVAHEAEAGRLAKAIRSIGDCRLETLPLVDLGEQREMILRCFLEETESALEDLAAEAHQALGRKPSLAAYQRLRRTYDDLNARTELYVQTLGDAAERTGAAHDVLKATLNALQRKL